MLRPDPADPRREIGLSEVDVGDGRHREHRIKLLRPDDATERTNVLPVVPEPEQSASLMTNGKPVLLHLCRNRECRAIAAHHDEMDAPTSPNPPIA
jgi:hypothetical protein